MPDFGRGRLPGRHLTQVPGPTNLPEAVRRAIDSQTLDHRGPQFKELTLGLLPDVKAIFATEGPVVMYPGSGTGAWEAALVNTLSPGERVLAVETGQFASLWGKLASRFGLDVEWLATDWRSPADPAAIEARLAADRSHDLKAVLLTHNETSTGTISDVSAVRVALDRARHPALLLVDAVSSLASVEYRHDAWGVDVTVATSQKGLMLPPGLAFNAVSDRALRASESARLPCSYWEWSPIIEANAQGFFPYTPPTNMMLGLRAALDLFFEEGPENVFARHRRHGTVAREAVRTWGLELVCRDERAYSPTVTAVFMPEGHPEDHLREIVLDEFGMSLGAGLGKWVGRAFRIGHLGDFDDLSLVATLAGVELGLDRADVPHRTGGVAAAVAALRQRSTAAVSS